MLIKRRSSEKSDNEPGRGASVFVFLFLISCGVILLLRAETIPQGVSQKLTEELGIVLISVFGVSLIYEHLIAETHFRRVYRHLNELIRDAETNAARCASLGIREIHETRSKYEQAHDLAKLIANCGPTTRVRIIGRSLIFSMQVWEDQLKKLLQQGACLELCFFAHDILSSPLGALSGYDPRETEMALEIFERLGRPWIQETRPCGKLEIRFHQVHLLDSIFEVSDKTDHWLAWDLNFGRGTAHRRIFVVDGHSPLGKNLTAGRYDLIWETAKVHFQYPGSVKDGSVNQSLALEENDSRPVPARCSPAGVTSESLPHE